MSVRFFYCISMYEFMSAFMCVRMFGCVVYMFGYIVVCTLACMYEVQVLPCAYICKCVRISVCLCVYVRL